MAFWGQESPYCCMGTPIQQYGEARTPPIQLYGMQSQLVLGGRSCPVHVKTVGKTRTGPSPPAESAAPVTLQRGFGGTTGEKGADGLVLPPWTAEVVLARAVAGARDGAQSVEHPQGARVYHLRGRQW